ncbi:hypothetical protein HF086_008393 [Spodoptera exigua]|uniref:Reverse transcriptase RNase H-like domain-containing protein n=1 Tax=Spodoptera exigua TaxID=7107 RepID=A0A922SGI7_SPOEX|nr:hypothetical protein HF086_008393 [Spodoptera exigua]
MRRDCVTKQAKDPLMKASLKKIPPTCTNLFNAEKFTAAIEKSGGVRKCFWPLQKVTRLLPRRRIQISFVAPRRGPSLTISPYKDFLAMLRHANILPHIRNVLEVTHLRKVVAATVIHLRKVILTLVAMLLNIIRSHRIIAVTFVAVRMLGKIINRGICENARYLPSEITTIKDVSIDSFRAGRLLHFADQWEQMNAPKILHNLPRGAIENLIWWRQNCEQSSAIHMPPPMHFLTTDASDIAWGARLGNLSLSGLWSEAEKDLHCNQKEMIAILRVLEDHCQLLKHKTILIQSDNKSLMNKFCLVIGLNEFKMARLALRASLPLPSGSEVLERDGYI